DADPHARAHRELSRLRVVFVAGSQLGAPLCLRATEAFGPVLYNVYGSTEAAYATIATPADLAEAPGCVGRPVPGAVVAILDATDRELPAGHTGRIFVGNDYQFEGYTGGGDKPRVRGLMATGDLGHIDAAGRLFVDGREDDMIVSGGENVFPLEVENLIAGRDDVFEAAVVGVDDREFGKRLRAFVVPGPGSARDPQEIKDYVKANLARYKVPREVIFLDELPRNATGKLLRKPLAEMPVPE
ncbi:AMP-binding protein, partial [Nocardia elegans]|uniref:AMP-binding enzyme n=1 Tax=Nocardia elegans TaxID=300029 RepID=UPI001893193D